MLDDIIIGKHTLESLTAGMYSDAKVIYREYIQNSVDAIDEAINSGITDKCEAKIDIEINKNNSKITIKDNGTGISSKNAVKKLLDIGNSTKNPESTIGFRGIGRLAGLSYCQKLKFVTSYKGEDKKTIVSFDANKLEKLLIPGEYTDYDLLTVIKEVTKSKKHNEKTDKHYFKVILEEVNNIDHILDYNRIKNYLSQVAPIPFDEQKFPWAKDIKNKLDLKGILLDEYNVILSDGNKKEKLFKLNSNEFVADIRKKISDNIKDVEIKFIEDDFNNLIAFLWYTKSNFYGTMVDRKKKGIRLRKGNIQIGDRSTLNKIFKEDRFNGWFQGEVHVFNENLIPNARRDDFEKNLDYTQLISQLKEIGNSLSKDIRKMSKERNNLKKKKQLYKKFDYLNDKIEKVSDFKILDLVDDLSQKEKEVLNKVFKIVDDNYEQEKVDEFVKNIVENF
ncbi:ATP-binding protein [Acetohalobium arabaticum]|uniref:ATP-binding region ATPase domain protein n=1 Tax=Acetohalobium arabaticum (strain ATCC 49924 / DSM 5501 / Z-7288) TaxID=574087 RepID=D9QVD4_ACEAZ|nr:ATP-binding protein [Acetohalobium arabaticum]ADL12193.1 conserved hypothetical protein [Acetohalobium arabaticum DSM 5501]